MIKLVQKTFFAEEEVKDKLIELIISGRQLSMGSECAAYEKKFAEKQECKYAVLVSSGSMANLVLVQALLNLGRLKRGARVGVSALTWATNIMPLIQLGLEPVLLDCDLDTLNVSAATLRAAHEQKKLDALFLTNVLGFCADIDKIAEFCAAEKILFFEDNCESLGTRVFGKLLGNFGCAATFSSYVAHHISTIEGGFVCTNDDALQAMLLMARAHGWDRNLSAERQTELRAQYGIDDFYAAYSFYDLAYNARPTEIQGVIGCLELNHLAEIISKRHEQFKRAQTAMNANENIYRFALDHITTISNFAVPVVFKTKELCAEYKTRFKDAGVEIRPVLAGNIGLQPFYKKYVVAPAVCPNADIIHVNGFYFSNNPHLSAADTETIATLLK